jgi:hypothetical protein
MQPTARLFSLHFHFGRPAKIALACLLIFLGTVAIVLALKWPFTQANLIRDMEHFSSSEVKVKQFHAIYLPHPGYVAEGLTFSRRSDGRPVEMASVKKLQCIASWPSIIFFQHRVKQFRIDGLHVSIPAPVPAPIPFYPKMKNRTTITTLIADGAVLDIAPRHAGGRPLRFEFRKLLLGEVKKDKSVSFNTSMHIPLPPGDLNVRAQFGPFTKGRLGETPLRGSYQLSTGDLREMKAIGGTLSSNGSFRGKLAQCKLMGNVRIDNFEVKNVHHPVELHGKFDATVNGMRGDVAIHSTKVRFLETELEATGTVQTSAHKSGKTESIEITGNQARIEDVLRLFTKTDPPSLKGPMRLHANIVLPPGPERFLRKVQLNGAFNISQAEFEQRKTRMSLNKLSKRARGHTSKNAVNAREDIPSNFRATVAVKDGTATLTDARFETRGARASGGGTYNLLTQQIDLRGKLAIEASLSKAAGGFKSILLVPLNPFFKKRNAGAVLPFHITGTYSRPEFHLSLKGGK